MTGSGKSVLLNGLIHNLIQQSPEQCRLYLIDPKKIGLAKFQHLPHVDGYATDTTDIIDMMQEILDLMHQCYEMMSEWDEISKETPVYVMIDELADLMINGGSQFWKLLQSLNQLCRAANIHVIAATQSPAKKIIPAEITINFTCKIALHCDDTTQSRQILGVPGAELLPKHGKALLKIDGKEIQKISIPYLDSETLKASVEAWQAFTPEPECETITIPEYSVRNTNADTTNRKTITSRYFPDSLRENNEYYCKNRMFRDETSDKNNCFDSWLCAWSCVCCPVNCISYCIKNKNQSFWYHYITDWHPAKNDSSDGVAACYDAHQIAVMAKRCLAMADKR